ncbi:MAG: hypothetical protein HY238_26570 [Acidobacteria bacterium]|nr:hypothetical protein [Acidobacteriota bacterium]
MIGRPLPNGGHPKCEAVSQSRDRKGAVGLLTILALLAALGHTEIIDRVAARVGTRVITRSEVEREARLEVYLNCQPLPDKAADHKETLERLIRQQLVVQEMQQTKFPPAGEEQIKKRLQGLLPAGEPPAKPADYGLKAEDLADYGRRLAAIDAFLALRFKNDEEIEAWLKEVQSRVKVQIMEAEKP